MFKRIGSKIIVVYGAITITAMIGLMWFYATQQEKSILAQNELTMGKMAQSISAGLQAVMLAGYADIAQDYAAKQQEVPDIIDFRIIRTDGNAAFLDNRTIDQVNARIGDEEFVPRDGVRQESVLPRDNPHLLQAMQTREMVPIYETSPTGERQLVYLAPILNAKDCQRCHGNDNPIRGIVKVTTSLSPVEHAILKTQHRALLVCFIMLLIILLATSYFVRHAVVRPIKNVTDAMVNASQGNLNQSVPIYGRDEISSMATSFNSMTSQLLTTYKGLESEQDKLNTIILSAREGIIITNREGEIVLTNPAAAQYLQKSNQEIREAGFLSIFDDEAAMLGYLSANNNTSPVQIDYKGRILSVAVSQIHTEEGNISGSAALLRDITEEKRFEQQLIKISTTDALTDLFNRRHLDLTLAQELERAQRYGQTLAILMFDVDHFKKFNDTHGHDQGDRVLQSLGQTMKDSVRTVDIPCRYGGEEFLVILPGTATEGAMILAERLRENVENTRVDGLQVTISIGVACFPDAPVASYDKLIEAADKALYEAKAAGRNCVRKAAPSADLALA